MAVDRFPVALMRRRSQTPGKSDRCQMGTPGEQTSSTPVHWSFCIKPSSLCRPPRARLCAIASSAELTSAETTAIRFQAEASDSPPLVARQELGKMRGSLAAALSDLHALQALLKDVKAKDHKPETQKVRPEAEEPPREPPLAVQLFMAPSSQTKAHPLTMPTSNSIATADTLPPRVVKYKDSEANQTNQPANSKACLPAANGCAHLKTKFLCLRSFDDSNLIEERGRKVAGEACVWCGGVRCVIGASSSEESGLRKSACAPRDWLLRGQGFAFQKFVAAFYYKVAKCELPPQK
eukprot:TRINITY_DN18231_c0_g1_i2.p1 TRINITY_DN18231_c0_g1~~TRINITY_DN18231_c0_g1_i2.p1  ORF type:complete len:294 (+),score=35.69 TRINITY_DN18231_c0_g1_i2:293-1174(+)